ncbi:hypothetical protein MP638_006155 [Amoeboaphelidium occidentale]|nr:hypothetical protein MP638_006155 [Amoeboaphelidium occidentale]
MQEGEEKGEAEEKAAA